MCMVCVVIITGRWVAVPVTLLIEACWRLPNRSIPKLLDFLCCDSNQRSSFATSKRRTVSAKRVCASSGVITAVRVQPPVFRSSVCH